jgi:hypothetical protein
MLQVLHCTTSVMAVSAVAAAVVAAAVVGVAVMLLLLQLTVTVLLCADHVTAAVLASSNRPMCIITRQHT